MKRMNTLFFLVTLILAVGFSGCQKESLAIASTSVEEEQVQDGIFRNAGEPAYIPIPEQYQSSPDYPIFQQEDYLELVDPESGIIYSGQLIARITLEGEMAGFTSIEVTGSLVDLMNQHPVSDPLKSLWDYFVDCAMSTPCFMVTDPMAQVACYFDCVLSANTDCFNDPDCDLFH
jgi:hypothetical protein